MEYTFKAYSDSSCLTTERGSTTFTTLKLSASDVSADRATLRLDNFRANYRDDTWTYKHTEPHEGSCSPFEVRTDTTDATGLTAGTTYTFKAHSDAVCSNLNGLQPIATVKFTTLGVSVNNLAETASATPALKVGGVSGDNNRVKRAVRLHHRRRYDQSAKRYPQIRNHGRQPGQHFAENPRRQRRRSSERGDSQPRPRRRPQHPQRPVRRVHLRGRGLRSVRFHQVPLGRRSAQQRGGKRQLLCS